MAAKHIGGVELKRGLPVLQVSYKGVVQQRNGMRLPDVGVYFPVVPRVKREQQPPARLWIGQDPRQ